MEVSRIACEGDECTCSGCLGAAYGLAPPEAACQPPIPGLVPVEPVQRPLPGIPCAMPSHKRYTGDSKQVLCDGVHYADACDENAASCIIDALNSADEQASWSTIIAQMR